MQLIPLFVVLRGKLWYNYAIRRKTMRHQERTEKFNKRTRERYRGSFYSLFVIRWIFLSSLISELMQLEKNNLRGR
jgi:hypothetical protein